MVSLSCLTDPSKLLVADASVAISLTATGCAEQILRALPNKVVVVDVVKEELETGKARGRTAADQLARLIEAGRISTVSLDERADGYFEELVVGAAAETLDDGEAATIAYAVAHDAIPILDERKANRLCAVRHPDLIIGCTTDLLAQEAVMRDLGKEGLASAALNALLQSNMRVQERHMSWIVELIGSEQAAQCKSLPLSTRTLAGLNR